MAAPSGGAGAPSLCTEEAVVAGWLCELGLGGQASGLSRDEMSALYEWCCCETTEDEVRAAMQRAVGAAAGERVGVEKALSDTLGVRADGYPSVMELAECAATLGLNRIDPVLMTGALADLEDDVHHLASSLDDLADERAKVVSQQTDAAELLNALKACEAGWFNYAKSRSENAQQQERSTATHHDKIAEYRSRLRRLENAMAAAGMDDALLHSTLAQQHEALQRTLQETAACRKRLDGYAVPPNATRARAKLLQLKAETKELQSRLPRYRRVTQSRIAVKH